MSDISYPDPRCPESPSRAHHYVHLGMSVWRCKYCWAVVWCPTEYGSARHYGEMMERLGVQKAYRDYLSGKPKTVIMLRKLEAIRLLRHELPERDFLLAVAAIVIDEGGYWSKAAEEQLAKAIKG